MIKFAVMTERFEYKMSEFANAEGAYFGIDDHNDKIVKVCDTIEEAREILAGIEVANFKFSSPIGTMIQAEVAYIEEADYDLNDDGEWEFVEGSNYWEFKYANE